MRIWHLGPEFELARLAELGEVAAVEDEVRLRVELVDSSTARNSWRTKRSFTFCS